MKCARLLLWQGASHHKGLFFSDAKLAVIPASHNSKVLFIAERRKEWSNDYDEMRNSFIYGETLSFDELMERMKELQERFKQIRTKDNLLQ